MRRMQLLGAATGALLLGTFASAAQAAPLGNAAGGLQTATGENALAQDVRWGRRCWRHRGHVHCRRGHWHYGYGDYYRGYGYGPSIGPHFGGHRHGHHRGHRHGHGHHRHR